MRNQQKRDLETKLAYSLSRQVNQPCSNPQWYPLSPEEQRQYPALDNSHFSDPVIECCEADELLTDYDVPCWDASGDFLSLADRIKLMRGETLALLDGLEMYRKAALVFEEELCRCRRERDGVVAAGNRMDNSELAEYRTAIKAFRRATARYF